MQGFAEGIQNALSYIETHLTDELDIAEIAAQAFVSPFYFQRMFSILTGMTVGEYIRCRRLSAAGVELIRSGARVIDIAVKYGYESQDSFSRAFTRFHGIAPSAAKEAGVPLKAFAPLRLKLTLEGGSVMEYKIVEKAAFTVVGIAADVPAEQSYELIPALWTKHLQSEAAKSVQGMFGICLDNSEHTLEYLIADIYFPQREIPAGCITRTIPAGTWAVFPCRGPLVETIQRVEKQIWSDWLPNCREYRLAENMTVEAYIEPPHENPQDDYNEIWIPVQKV